MTDEQKKYQRNWARKWRKDNPKKVKAAKQKYYKKHKKEIIEKARQQNRANPEKRKVIYVRSHEKHKTKRKLYQKRKNEEKTAFLNSLKEKGCSICFYNTCYAALEFHHINPKEKDKTMKQLSKDKILEEIKKCILVCSNCHREIHEKLRNYNQMRNN